MEGVLVLFGLIILGLAAVAPILALVALARARGLQSTLEGLQVELRRLEAHVSALRAPAERARAEEGGPAPVVPSAPAPSSGPPTTASASPSPPGSGAAPPRPASITSPPVPSPPGPAHPPTPGPTAGPLGSPPPATPPSGPGAPALGPAPPPPPPLSAPPRPPRPESPTPPGFDWESLLGLKGAAWMGGVAIVIAAIFLAKMAYDRGYFGPELRMAVMLGTGIGGLVWAELSLRRGYATTANAVSGAAIAILYIALYSGHALWHLVGTAPTFGLMALVTLVAGLVAVRYDAVFTAVLGLLGGFSTPILVSTGEDRPVSLFSYILLLNVGLSVVAVSRRWYGLLVLGLVGTFVIEFGWFSTHMSPEKVLVGLVAFLGFGLLNLFLPTIASQEDQPTLRQVAALGGSVPFVFGLLIAGGDAYAREWGLLFGYLALLDAALIAVALLRGHGLLLAGGALATALTLPVWAGRGLPGAGLWGPSLGAVGLAVLLNLPVPLAPLLGAARVKKSRRSLEVAGIVGSAGLGLFTLVLLIRSSTQPLWPFVVLLAALTALLVARTGEGRLPGVAVLGPPALALLAQVWFFKGTGGETLLRNLSVPLLLAIALSLVAAYRARAPVSATEDEAGVVGSTAVALAGLFACLLSPDLGRDPVPLFAALVITLVLFLSSALRRDWAALVLGSLLAAALFTTAWQFAYFHPAADLPVALPVEAGLYLAFLALPFLMPKAVANRWKERAAPWVASALSGPAFFLALHDAVSRTWGKAMIGLLPLIQAALTLPALAGISRRFGGRDQSGRRLDFMALFAAVALGFVALAIPLQLDKQWITVGWALEGTAVFWLYGRLPHGGLKWFGALLFAGVGARLLFNWDNVLHYEERGRPIFNWLLYTYGVPALACLTGAAALRRAEAARKKPAEPVRGGASLSSAVSLLGLILTFVLINLEVVDFYSPRPYLELTTEPALARDLTMSVAWALYATVLLVIGFWREVRALRFLSLAFLALTVAKVFLYDLSRLAGIYRVLAFLALGVVSLLVSLLYGRALRKKEEHPT